ncbi:MAG: response regulator, partial [Bacteroidetes bacterium]
MANTTGRDNLRVSAALPIAEQARVLLIEDDLSYAGYVQALFYMNDELDGELVVAHTLAAGVKHLREQGEFDAVLLDLNLPDSQGLDTLSWLLGQVPKANVIVLTGNEDRGQGVQAVAAGAQDFLVKNSALEAQLPRAICFSIQRKYFLQRLEEAQNLARIGNWEIRPDDNYFYASPAVYNFFQLDREEHTCSRYEE